MAKFVNDCGGVKVVKIKKQKQKGKKNAKSK